MSGVQLLIWEKTVEIENNLEERMLGRMTMTTVFELITILSLFVLTVALWFSGEIRRKPLDVEDESMTMWTMRARRIGPAKWRLRSLFARESTEKIRLTEGTLTVGNRLKDECYIDDTGERVKLFLNVQRQKILVNVLKGRVYVGGECYEVDEDVDGRIEMRSGMKIELDDVELEFIRGG